MSPENIQMIAGDNIQSVALQFAIPEVITDIQPFGNGLINDSFRVSTNGERDYFLQRINTNVFPNVDSLMKNISLVTDHLRYSGKNISPRLTVIPTQAGRRYLRVKNECWRMYIFIGDGRTVETAPNPQICFEAGRGFGNFAAQLIDLDPKLLDITIPDFHNMSFRIQQLHDALQTAPKERVNAAGKEIKNALRNAERMISIHTRAVNGGLPERIMHNDTKLNNIMFESEGTACAVLDLDTVMPGYVIYDFGDGIRSSAMSGTEDEEDTENISVDFEKYEYFLRGYLEATSAFLTKNELMVLPHAGSYMAFIMGIRFLADYLNGDTYYKTQYPDQNLLRARAQLSASEKLDEYSAQAFKILKSYG